MLFHSKKRLGEILIDEQIINQKQLEYVLKLQKSCGEKLGELLVREGMAKEAQIVDILSNQLDIPRMRLGQQLIEPSVSGLLNENIARRYELIAVGMVNRCVTVAMTDPFDLAAVETVKASTGCEVKAVIASRSEILEAINLCYGKETAEKAVEDFSRQFDPHRAMEENNAYSEINNAPVVKLVNSLIEHAAKLNASDIHIEPFEKTMRVRFRIDGELQEIMATSRTAYPAIVTRIKIMGNMDIAEKRVPQDGTFETAAGGRDLDLRISVFPSIYGEKIVVRLLGKEGKLRTKTDLGFSANNIILFDRIIKSPYGIILLAGPTGSGKTTTLYTVIKELYKRSLNIITLEDPVEYRIDGITQSQVNTRAGLTFASGLRSILRQDPDIIMIGEIRDPETAQIAVRAAITGHLVLSTIHTNDCASTISRLQDMGIEPYLLSSSVAGIVSQRLVRVICNSCKEGYPPEKPEAMLLGLQPGEKAYRGRGCDSCGFTGYKGRTAVHEVMPINRELRELIDRKAQLDELRSASFKNGTTTLRSNCIELVRNGVTTVEELLRISYNSENT